MEMNRREFVILAAGTLAAGCAGGGGASPPAASGGTAAIDAGPAADYAADGVYDRFHDRGFFVVKDGARLFALSSICTHRHCALKAEADHSFYCKCHGSTFDPGGRVTQGPATRDLPELPSSVDGNGHFIVHPLVGA